MSWRGSTTPIDRLFAALIYLLPMSIAAFSFGRLLLDQLHLDVILQLLAPIAVLNTGLIGFAVFIALFILVVNNTAINHFVRFNVFQAILIDIILTLILIVLPILTDVFGFIPGFDQLNLVLSNTIFLGVFAAGVYGIVQSALGRYAEIPSLSNVVYSQLR
jgi:hypothetical protein